MYDKLIDGDYIRERITKLRLEKGVSEREMSLSLGMCESYVRNITTAPSLPSMSSFLNICEYFNIRPEEFFNENLESPLAAQDAALALDHLFGEHLPSLTKSIKRLDKQHAEAIVEIFEALRR